MEGGNYLGLVTSQLPIFHKSNRRLTFSLDRLTRQFVYTIAESMYFMTNTGVSIRQLTTVYLHTIS